MTHRDVMQQALDQIQSVMEMAFHERYAECCGRGSGGECCGSPVEAWPDWARNVMDGLADSQRALSAELAKPAAVPDTCRQKLKKEGKPYPRSSCNFCGQLFPRWRDCDAMLYASPQPTAPAVSPVDVEAVRGTIFRMKDNHKLRESRGKPDPLISIWANELARAIGDEK